ncbi:MMPL family transporter [Streptomyces hoynatensis]|uniref:MMPL family transporter n=1 Tax=Streptomyces hoynatensis TaxID=1141874 RepID=A0A3A9YPC2_9ACTN|nr:MMPL family transporter [Streptomyces hoynatensis]RKN37294.1 MMPL family transporter [Streptomyces hoynatensis]
MSTLARWCHRRRLLVLLLWLACLVGLGVASGVAGDGYRTDFTLPDSESSTALDLMSEATPDTAGATAGVVWEVDEGSVADAAPRDRVEAALAQIAALPGVGSVVGPWDEGGAGQIGAGERIAYARIAFTEQSYELDKGLVQNVIDTARAAATEGLTVELGGEAISVAEEPSAAASEIVAVVFGAVVLFVAFGSLVGMAVPLVIAVAGVGTAMLSMGLLAHGIGIADIAPTLGALIGLGVGIDYALFIVTRHRSGLKAGLGPEESVVTALDTAGRAVVFAAITVILSVLGLFALGMGFLNGVAIAAALTVLCTVLASVTLLPALLGFMGMRVLRPRERRELAEQGPAAAPARPGLIARWAAVVERRPLLLSAVAVLVIAVLAAPTLSLRLGNSDQGTNPDSFTSRKAYDMLAEGFGPGFNGPLLLVAEAGDEAGRQALGALTRDLPGVPGVAEVHAYPMQAGSPIGIVQVTPRTSPQAEETSELISRLREEVIPQAAEGTDLHVYVGGQTAVNDDFSDTIADRMFLFIGVIVALGCLLLLLAFRSLVIPLTAAVMNLMAALAAFGVVVAAFQWGWVSDAVGMGTGPVEPFLPVLMLPVLFGLSMDYQVFLVSRMHEEWVHGRDNRRAVIVGQSETGRVITAAATIMIAVFLAFILGGQRVISMFGAGLAVAVALDAFILRTVLVPAAMHVLGRSNWWLPGWLDRVLPHLSVERPGSPAARPPAGATAAPAADASAPVGSGH